jgi:hypothetical protein
MGERNTAVSCRMPGNLPMSWMDTISCQMASDAAAAGLRAVGMFTHPLLVSVDGSDGGSQFGALLEDHVLTRHRDVLPGIVDLVVSWRPRSFQERR